jgi:hypothetical protein
MDVEVLSVLRRWERHWEVGASRVEQALADLLMLPIIRYPGRALIGRARSLRHNLAAYDAQYVALAEALSASLLTSDDGMAERRRVMEIQHQRRPPQPRPSRDRSKPSQRHGELPRRPSTPRQRSVARVDRDRPELGRRPGDPRLGSVQVERSVNRVREIGLLLVE